MQQFPVDDDLAELVWQLAKPRPFENLSFSAALRRVLRGEEESPAIEKERARTALGSGGTNSTTNREPKKAPTPSPTEWVASVPELKNKKGLTTWKSICNLLKIDTAGDSARRKLKNWTKLNHPSWPAVPNID